MNNDLISREALREDLRRFFPTEVLEGIEPKTLFAQIMHDIDNAPTVIVDNYSMGYQDGIRKVLSERPQGEWIKLDNGFGKPIHLCSNCGERALEKLVRIDTIEEVQSNFCPNCGLRMVKNETD